MTMRFDFLKLLDSVLVRERSALAFKRLLLSVRVEFCGYVCYIFYSEVVCDNVVSNDVTITSAPYVVI